VYAEFFRFVGFDELGSVEFVVCSVCWLMGRLFVWLVGRLMRVLPFMIALKKKNNERHEEYKMDTR
jgi:hypothetical protein